MTNRAQLQVLKKGDVPEILTKPLLYRVDQIFQVYKSCDKAT